jgi:3-oxoacyl-[acyl-carrier protein] reductase
MQITSLTALVTGAASGIGRCFALELLRAGATVTAGDVDERGLEALQAAAGDLRGRLAVMRMDVSNEGQVRSFISDSTSRFGCPNLLVNNAGILRDGLLISREDGFVRKLPTAQWKSVLDVNLTGPYLMARETAALMVEHSVRPGLIVNVSSITSAGNPGQSNYAAAKAGLDADTRTWALELAPFGIRVAGIAPGLTDTPMAARLSEIERARIIESIPLGRMGSPEEIWLALKFIIECDFLTGRVISVDGGASHS